MHVTHKYLFNNNTVYINQYFERSHLSPACIQCSCMATSNRIIMSAKPTQRFKCRYIRFPSLSLSTCLVSICSQHSVLVTGDSRSNLCEYCLHIHTHLYTYVFVRFKKIIDYCVYLRFESSVSSPLHLFVLVFKGVRQISECTLGGEQAFSFSHIIHHV